MTNEKTLSPDTIPHSQDSASAKTKIKQNKNKKKTRNYTNKKKTKVKKIKTKDTSQETDIGVKKSMSRRTASRRRAVASLHPHRRRRRRPSLTPWRDSLASRTSHVPRRFRRLAGQPRSREAHEAVRAEHAWIRSEPAEQADRDY